MPGAFLDNVYVCNSWEFNVQYQVKSQNIIRRLCIPGKVFISFKVKF